MSQRTTTNKLIPFLREVLTLPYVSNAKIIGNKKRVELVRGHEIVINKLLVKHQLAFEYQPNGSQKSPDFRINISNISEKKFLDIELKSTKGAYPMYNGGLPQKDVVYIFCSKKYNKTTIFFGRDIITERKRELYNELVTELKEVVYKHQQKSC